VGAITFSEREVLGLSADQRTRLAGITAFGLVVARGHTAAAGEPFVEGGRARAMRALLDAARALDSMRVSDGMLATHYRSNPEYELTVRHLIVLSDRYETDRTRAAARAKAEAALERIRAGEDFAEVAAQVSEEPGAEGRQGLLEPGREGAWVDEFWRAAMGLDPSDISDVVETRYGFHVLRLEGRDTVPFEEARPRVVLEAAAGMGLPASAAATASGGGLQALQDSLAARGLHLPGSTTAELERDWTSRVERWAGAMGFREGMSDDQVREAAAAAFGATGQAAGLARSEVLEFLDLLRDFVEIEVRG
jgi:hypothetical protein